MSPRIRWAAMALVALLSASVLAPMALACTGVRLTAKDGSVIYARTLEFGADLASNVIIVPRGYAYHGTTSTGNPGLAWQAKYAAVGMNAQQLPQLADGVNEKGLAGGIFYLPGYAGYQEVTPADESNSLAPWEVVTWILTNFATVDEVRAAIPRIQVGNVVFGPFQFVPPVHYVVHDAAGESLVIEYIGGKLNLHDNPLGIITNSPEFDWHLKNLANYVNLSATNVPPVEVAGLKLRAFGQGSGMLGIPGDFTPPSRFVRASLLSQSAFVGDGAEPTVATAFHILDSFDIPRGAIRDTSADRAEWEFTQWTTASDTRHSVYYFHTYDNRRVRRVDLSKARLDAAEIVSIPLRNTEDIEDLTPTPAG